MTYCTVADIEAYYLNKTFKCDDYVSEGKVNTFIIQDSALIDAMISSRYTPPFTNAGDLLILKMINEKMVCGTIDDIIREKTETGEFERSRGIRKEALELLKKIVEGDIVLHATGNTSSMKFNVLDSDGNEIEKRFKDSNVEPTAINIELERRA